MQPIRTHEPISSRPFPKQYLPTRLKVVRQGIFAYVRVATHLMVNADGAKIFWALLSTVHSYVGIGTPLKIATYNSRRDKQYIPIWKKNDCENILRKIISGTCYCVFTRDRGSITCRVIPKTQKWYLIPPCLTLSIIRYVSRVKWSNPRKGVAPSPTPRCRKERYWKGSLRIALDNSRST